MKTQIDLRKPLSVKTVSDILVYLESRPLGEVLVLFQDIIKQLSVEDAVTNGSQRLDSTAAGGGDSRLGGDSVSAVEAQ